MSESKIKVIVVDDHAILRSGIQQILATTEQIEVIAEAENAAEAIKLSREVKADVMLLDISLPDRSGIDALKHIKRDSPKLSVLMDEEKVKSPHEALSDREFQTMILISSGFSVSEIAQKLALSVKTVSMYRTRLLEKMHLRHNADITHYAVRNQLV